MALTWDTTPPLSAARLAPALAAITILPMSALRPAGTTLLPQILAYLEEHRILAFAANGANFGKPAVDHLDVPVDTASGRCLRADSFGRLSPAMRPSEFAQGLADRLGYLVSTDEFFASLPGAGTIDLAARPLRWHQVLLGRRTSDLTVLARKAAEPAFGAGIMDRSFWAWQPGTGRDDLPELLARATGADVCETRARGLTMVRTVAPPRALVTGINFAPPQRPAFELHHAGTTALLLRHDPDPARDLVIRLSAHPGDHIGVPADSPAQAVLEAILMFNDVGFARTGDDLAVRVADEVLRVQRGLPLTDLPARLAAIARVIDDFPPEALAPATQGDGSDAETLPTSAGMGGERGDNSSLIAPDGDEVAPGWPGDTPPNPGRNSGDAQTPTTQTLPTATTHLAERDPHTSSPVADPQALPPPHPYRYQFERPNPLIRATRSVIFGATFMVVTSVFLLWFLWAAGGTPSDSATQPGDVSAAGLWTLRLIIVFSLWRTFVAVRQAVTLWRRWARTKAGPYPFDF